LVYREGMSTEARVAARYSSGNWPSGAPGWGDTLPKWKQITQLAPGEWFLWQDQNSKVYSLGVRGGPDKNEDGPMEPDSGQTLILKVGEPVVTLKVYDPNGRRKQTGTSWDGALTLASIFGMKVILKTKQHTIPIKV